jgi:hypothetical protein
MKPTPLPAIVFPPQLTDHNAHELLRWLRTLLHTLEGYYADPLPRPDPCQTQLNLWDDEDIPF